MRTTLRDVAALALAGGIALSVAGWAADAPAQQPPPQGGPGTPGQMMAPPDTNDPDVKALMALRTKIAGKEHMPADSVFENVKAFKGVEAGRLLGAMGGFTRALGSHCTLCHVSGGKWASDDKKEKNMARGMMRFTGMLNDSLHTIANIDEDAHIGCMTCHRGQPKPSSGMPQRPGGGMGQGGPGGPPPGGAPGGGGMGGGGDHH
jgi:hypothetical protein